MRDAVRAVVLDDDDRVMLLRYDEEGGFWATPGGSLEDGEDDATVPARELGEELGVEQKVVELGPGPRHPAGHGQPGQRCRHGRTLGSPYDRQPCSGRGPRVPAEGRIRLPGPAARPARRRDPRRSQDRDHRAPHGVRARG
ncbi:NUDIX domain-containing protein [Streptomyces sp. NPDC057616]|uniref:NUDIX domain-containing protein n=1 Tax=Streptomyces sp. NPDC057616 TaxID=3346183 RepID=UPI0036CDD8EC